MDGYNYLLQDIDEALCLYAKGNDSALTFNAHLECAYQSAYKLSYTDVLISEFASFYNRIKLSTLNDPNADKLSTLRLWDSITYVIWLYLEYQRIDQKKIQDQSTDWRHHTFYSQQVYINRGFLFVSAIRKTLDLIVQKNKIGSSVGSLINKIDREGLYSEYKEDIRFLYIVNKLANSNKHSLLLQQYNITLLTEKVRVFGVDTIDINLNENINNNEKMKFFSIAEGHLETINRLLRFLCIQAKDQGASRFPLVIEYNINPAHLLISYLVFIKKVIKLDKWDL